MSENRQNEKLRTKMVRIQGNGKFRRAGRVWATVPALVAVIEHDKALLERPAPPPGCEWVITTAELARMLLEAKDAMKRGIGHPLRIDDPDAFDSEIHGHAAVLSEVKAAIESERHRLDDLRVQREELETQVKAVNAELALTRRLLAEAEDKAQRAGAAAQASEERARASEERLRQIEEQQRNAAKGQGKGQGK